MIRDWVTNTAVVISAWLGALIVAGMVGCLDPTPGPGPGPTPGPTGTMEHAGAVAMDKLRANHAAVAEQMANAIDAGKITSANDERRELSKAIEAAQVDAFSDVYRLRDDRVGDEWRADTMSAVYRELARGYAAK